MKRAYSGRRVDAKIALRWHMKRFWKFVYWARYYGNEGLSGHCAISRISEPSARRAARAGAALRRRAGKISARWAARSKARIDARKLQSRLFSLGWFHVRVGKNETRNGAWSLRHPIFRG